MVLFTKLQKKILKYSVIIFEHFMADNHISTKVFLKTYRNTQYFKDVTNLTNDKEIKDATHKLNLNKVYLNRRETFSMLKSIIIEFGWLKLLQPSGIFEGGLFFPKKGDLSLQKNYKGIMILEIASKIIAIIL